MFSVKGALVGFLAGLFTMLTATSQADAAPAVASAGTASVCETGHRGQAEYDRKCLTVAKFRDGAMLWLTIPEGRAGHAGRYDFTRRSICKFPGKYGLHAAVKEAQYDVAYDTYRNHLRALRWAGDVAVLDCLSMGYKINKF